MQNSIFERGYVNMCYVGAAIFGPVIQIYPTGGVISDYHSCHDWSDRNSRVQKTAQS